MTITPVLSSDESVHMMSFERSERRQSDNPGLSRPQLWSKGSSSTSVNKLRNQPSTLPSGTLCSSSVQSQAHLQSRFAELRDAIYFNESAPGFLLSADETFCYPNYAGQKDAVPVEVDDIFLFLDDWDIWDWEFKARLPKVDWPCCWLNRHRTSWKNWRVGLHEGGKKYVLESSGVPLYNPDGEYIGGVVWQCNLGEYDVVAAKDLEASLADFKTICDRLPHILWTVDPEGRADYFSRRWYELTGFDEAQSLGNGFENAIHPDDMQQINSYFKQAAAISGEVRCEARYKHRDGHWIWMAVKAKPAVGLGGRALKWYGSSTDIHDLVMERLEAERTKLQAMGMLAHAEVALFHISTTWQLSKWGGNTWFGSQGADHETSSDLFMRLRQVQEDGSSEFETEIRRVMRGETQATVLEQGLNSRWYRCQLQRDLDVSCDPPTTKGVLACLIDMTEHRQRAALEAENVRLTAERTLEVQKSNLKTSFLAHMSHELRTPIAGVIGMADMLMETALSDKQQSLLECIQVSANNLLIILNDILDIAKVESGKMQLEIIPFKLADVVHQIGKLFETNAQRKFLALEVNQCLPSEVEMLGDPGRIKQILSNLMSNAIKFTSEGSVKFQIQIDGTMARFCVEDTGMGIDDKTKQKLFTPFSQGDSSAARRHGGTGLGLIISRNLAELMGGSLKIESRLSEGTKAIFIVPLRSKLVPSPPAVETNSFNIFTTSPVTQARSPQAKPPDKSSNSKKIILVAEDNSINQKVALHSVRKLGYHAEAVWNGQEALDYLNTYPDVGLILMDCQMPLLDGYEATRQLRQSAAYQEFRDLPIIALTASAIKGDREACQEAGMNDYLTKPIQKQLLKEMLERWFPG